jgi:hypothetical protein
MAETRSPIDGTKLAESDGFPLSNHFNLVHATFRAVRQT